VKTLHLVVLTPQATVFDAVVEAVIVPLSDGWRGILPGHANFQARLMRGHLLFRVGGKERIVATLGGALAVDNNTVTVLTGVAVLDRNLETMEREISEETQRLTALEQEAEKHFNRVYRQMARTFNHRGARHP
jgi:F-type H+-transporting ATPase subunit epsilon